jgi:hypothetical protein
MKATVVGAAVPAKTLRAACARAEVPAKDVRTVGTRAWVELPPDARDAMLARLADVLSTGFMVIEVDMPAGLRGDGIVASRATYRGVEEDITNDAKKILGGWLAEGSGRRVEEDVAASQLAWALIEGDGVETNPAESNIEEIWAQTLIDQLVAAGSLELRSKQLPINRVAHILQNPGRDLGNRLLAELIDSPAVDEVFADADDLARVARETKPKRQ